MRLAHIDRRRVPPYGVLAGGLGCLAVALFGASLAIGYAPLDLPQALRDVVAGRPTLGALVLIELRLPRALLGGIVGFSLGLAGAAMQGLMRNPLAEPGIIGVSGAAALRRGDDVLFRDRRRAVAGAAARRHRRRRRGDLFAVRAWPAAAPAP